MFQIRLMQVADLGAVARLQDHCYSDELYEAPELLSQRLMLYPQSCWVAVYQDKIWGYLFTYPSTLSHINPLGAEFGRYEQANCLYLHDMAVSPDARGLGVASALLQSALSYAVTLGLSHLALVAVQNSASFWQQQHFSDQMQLSSEASAALATYGSHARYLTRPVSL